MQKDKKYEKWENSIEGILYSLKIVGDVNAQDQKNNLIIAQVIQKLPKKVKEKVLDEVTFVHTTAYGTIKELTFSKFIEQKEMEKVDGNGFIKPGYYIRIPKVFIILNFKCIRSPETKMDTIAHEIAHFINKPKDGYKTRDSDIEEKMADDLAEKWGFKRSYKSYREFKGKVTGIG